MRNKTIAWAFAVPAILFAAASNAAIPAVPTELSVPAFSKVYTDFYIGFGTTEGADTYKLYENGSFLTERFVSPVRRVIAEPGKYDYQLQACNTDGCSALSPQSEVVISVPPITFQTMPGYFNAGQSFTINAFDHTKVVAIKIYVNDQYAGNAVKTVNNDYSFNLDFTPNETVRLHAVAQMSEVVAGTNSTFITSKSYNRYVCSETETCLSPEDYYAFGDGFSDDAAKFNTMFANVVDDSSKDFFRLNSETTKTKVFLTPGKTYCINQTLVVADSLTIDSADPNDSSKPVLKQCARVDGPLLDMLLADAQKLVIVKNIAGEGHFSPDVDNDSAILTAWAKMPFSSVLPVGSSCDNGCKSNYYNSFIRVTSGGKAIFHGLTIDDFSYGIDLNGMGQFKISDITNDSFLDRLVKVAGDDSTINYIDDAFDGTINDPVLAASAGIPGGNWNSALRVNGTVDLYLPAEITTPIRHVCVNGDSGCLSSKNSGAAFLSGSSASDINVQHVTAQNIFDNCVYVSSGASVTINDVNCSVASGTAVKVRGPNMKVTNVVADNTEVGVVVQNIALSNQLATTADIASVTVTNARSSGVIIYRYNFDIDINQVNLCGADVTFGPDALNESRYGLIVYGDSSNAEGTKYVNNLKVDACANLAGSKVSGYQHDFGLKVDKGTSGAKPVSYGVYVTDVTNLQLRQVDNGASGVFLDDIDTLDICIDNPGGVLPDGTEVPACTQ